MRNPTQVLDRGRQRLTTLLRRFGRDRSGGTAVQAIVMMPIIIVTFFTIFQIWQMIQVRDTLHYANYQAMRYLSLYPLETDVSDEWTEVAEKIVLMELRNNPYLITEGRPMTRYTDYDVEVTLLNNEYECKSPFRIESWVSVHFVPTGPTDRFGLPGIRPFRMDDVREGEVLCQ
jgi:hypothetical protein